jgi:hypothetical protein
MERQQGATEGSMTAMLDDEVAELRRGNAKLQRIDMFASYLRLLQCV